MQLGGDLAAYHASQSPDRQLEVGKSTATIAARGTAITAVTQRPDLPSFVLFESVIWPASVRTRGRLAGLA